MVTEGEKTEVQYIQGLVQFLKKSGVAVRTPTTKGVGRDPVRVLDTAVKLAGEANGIDPFDSVWIVVDVDEHARLKECLRYAATASIEAVISNPCFEIWLLWHLEDMGGHRDATWLARRLARLGHGGKCIDTSFPFANYVDASERACKAGCETGQIGSNPSTAMHHLVAALNAPLT